MSTSNARRVLAEAAPTLTGPQWEARVMARARAMGYRVFHPHDSRRSEPGFPDITAAKPGRLLFLECKTGRGKLTDEQIAWRDTLIAAGCEWYEVRPEWEAEVLAILVGETGGQR